MDGLGRKAEAAFERQVEMAERKLLAMEELEVGLEVFRGGVPRWR